MCLLAYSLLSLEPSSRCTCNTIRRVSSCRGTAADVCNELELLASDDDAIWMRWTTWRRWHQRPRARRRRIRQVPVMHALPLRRSLPGPAAASAARRALLGPAAARQALRGRRRAAWTCAQLRRAAWTSLWPLQLAVVNKPRRIVLFGQWPFFLLHLCCCRLVNFFLLWNSSMERACCQMLKDARSTALHCFSPRLALLEIWLLARRSHRALGADEP